MYLKIPADHVESFDALFERLTTHGGFFDLPASNDPNAPLTESTTAIYCGFVNFQFMPRGTETVLRDSTRMVLKSRCNTMLISYRFLEPQIFEATLYRDEPVKISDLYLMFRMLVRQQSRHFERTGLSHW